MSEGTERGEQVAINQRWQLKIVDDIKSSEKHSCVAGPFGSSISAKYFVDQGVPIIRGSNLSLGMERFVADSFAFISQETAAKFSAQTVRADDLVFTCWGTIGQVGIIPKDGPYERYVISNKQLKLRVDREQIDPLFAYYYFASPSTVDLIKGRAIGSAVPGINLGILKALPVPVPPMEDQRRIVAILGAYDDLIEVNRRRIAILEEMARRLFDEWFVHFRFPGHEGYPMVETEQGRIPQGWRCARLDDLCDRITDGAHHSPTSTPDGALMASVKDMRAWGFELAGCRRISEVDFETLTRAGCKPEVGDIVIAKDGANLNKHTFLIDNDVPVVLLSSIAILKPARDVGGEFLVAMLRSETVSAAIKLMKSGAAIPRIVLRDFKRLMLILPDGNTRSGFEAVIGPIHKQCRTLTRLNTNLEIQRDLLLPRLISGELPVSAAEAALEAAA